MQKFIKTAWCYLAVSPFDFAQWSLILQSNPTESYAGMTKNHTFAQDTFLGSGWFTTIGKHNYSEVSTSSNIFYNFTAVQNIFHC